MKGSVDLGIGMLRCLGSAMNEILFHITVVVGGIIEYNILFLLDCRSWDFGYCDELVGDSGTFVLVELPVWVVGSCIPPFIPSIQVVATGYPGTIRRSSGEGWRFVGSEECR